MKKINKLILGFAIIFLLMIINATIVNASSTKIDTPKNVKASISGTSNVKITWNKVEGAKKYKIYRATSKKGKYKKIATINTTSYKDQKTSRGTTYYYKVVAKDANSSSKKSAYAKVKVLTKKQVLKKIRNALKDKKWVKNNVKMKFTAFDTKIEGKQELYFGKIKNKELVAVEAVSPDAYSVQMFLVGYKNGKVVATSSTRIPVHYFHGGPCIDLNNGVAAVVSLHMGYMYERYFKVSNVKFKDLATFEDNEGAMENNTFYEKKKKKVSKSKYQKEMKKYSKYKLSSLQISGGHKLTAKNIDKYVK